MAKGAIGSFRQDEIVRRARSKCKGSLLYQTTKTKTEIQSRNFSPRNRLLFKTHDLMPILYARQHARLVSACVLQVLQGGSAKENAVYACRDKIRSKAACCSCIPRNSLVSRTVTACKASRPYMAMWDRAARSALRSLLHLEWIARWLFRYYNRRHVTRGSVVR